MDTHIGSIAPILGISSRVASRIADPTPMDLMRQVRGARQTVFSNPPPNPRPNPNFTAGIDQFGG
jgi:hypothetical protein